jgi:mannitol-1-/sugar-/sorbitol-6-/2-deoxyglucose-6-phosphatase
LTVPPIRAVVLDMDGLLIDTEPVWRTAAREILAGLGIDLTPADLLDTTGVRVDEMVAAFLTRQSHPAPLVPLAPLVPSAPPVPSPAEVADAITDLVIAYVSRAGEPMPGVPEAIALFRRSGLRLAIASSSPLRLIDAVCARLDLDIEIRCTALDEPHGKPAPDVYLAAARRLGLSPARCLAVEDSPAGVLAAKAAGMTCLAVPDPLLAGDPRYRRADLVLSSLTELDEQALCPLTT